MLPRALDRSVKIYDRYQEVGVRGLTDRSPRPYRHANQLPLVIEKTIVRLKREYPSWGGAEDPRRLRQRCPDVQCPAAARSTPCWTATAW